MAHKSLFASFSRRLSNKTDSCNLAGGRAYKYEDQHKLAQLAVTGSIGDLHYQSAELELQAVLVAAAKVSDEFLAKTAIYARQNGKMKDLPALLLAILASRDPVLLSRVFGEVVTNGKILRNFVQIMRSGQTGRKSLGTRPKALVQAWLNNASDYQLLQANIGQAPSLADVIKMVHPKPGNEDREALYAWLIGKPCALDKLPEQVRDYVAYKDASTGSKVPDVPFQMLTSLPLSTENWAVIARRGSWNMVRMNLNTFLRHGVFDNERMVKYVAKVLSDPKRVRKANAFPYQLMTTYQALSEQMPREICEALHDAMEIAVSNVPAFGGNVVVCPDISSSMDDPVTGERGTATTATRFVDIAALVSAAVLRQNRRAEILPFDFAVREVQLKPQDSILTNAQKLAKRTALSTDCSAPLVWLNKKRKIPDLVIMVSDNQSWVDQSLGGLCQAGATNMMDEWEALKRRHPKAKLVCIDIAPYGTAQIKSRPDVLNIGGFSDAIFEQIAAFASDQQNGDYWISEIEKIEIS